MYDDAYHDDVLSGDIVEWLIVNFNEDIRELVYEKLAELGEPIKLASPEPVLPTAPADHVARGLADLEAYLKNVGGAS